MLVLQGQSNMLNQIALLLKSCVPASIRFEIRQKKGQFKHLLPRLCFWRWQHFSFPLSETNPIVIHYKGRPENKAVLMALLGASAMTAKEGVPAGDKVYVTEHYMRDAICIPFTLITIVKLGRSIEDIVASYSKSLRRSINSELPNYRYQSITEVKKIDAIENSMLKPYAIARHDTAAAQLQPGFVRKFAQEEHGRLDLLLQGEEEVM